MAACRSAASRSSRGDRVVVLEESAPVTRQGGDAGNCSGDDVDEEDGVVPACCWDELLP
jgi:hypothetical protein